jgi:hypothetical protein
MAEQEFQPLNVGNKDCSDQATSGVKSTRFDYVVKSLTGDSDYPSDACTPYLHGNMQVDNIQINGNADADTVTATEVTASGITLTSRKAFDIPHPTKKNYRLRHICLEGPESGVYFRGVHKDSNYIELPEYWSKLVDPESITVSLTPIGYSQDLIVESIEWGRRIKIKSNSGANVHCYYLIHGTRVDGDPLIVEYEGETPADYPGNNDQFSVAGFHYDTRT